MAISRLYDFTAGQPIKSQEVDDELNALIAAVNAVLPVGTVLPTARSGAPTGFLLCDGSAVSRSTYSDLFAAIGTTYGTGNGSTTFNLPDLRGRVPVGLGTHADANALSDNDALGLASRTPHPDLPTGASSHNVAVDQHGDPSVPTVNVARDDHQHNIKTGPAYAVVNYMIRT